MKKISIIIPCYNEEDGIAKVIEGIQKEKLRKLGYRIEIIVIDNNSKDRTSEIAKKLKSRVIQELKQGKGYAIKSGFSNLSKDTDYVVMIDGDDTYKTFEITRLIDPIDNNFCDVILGSRLEDKIIGKAMEPSHRLANWFFTFFVRHFYKTNVTDVCTGYFAWKKEVVDALLPYIESKGFAIETEMVTKMAKMGYKIYSVPITYDKREGYSKLSPISDGLRITKMLIKNLFWKPK